MKKKWLIGLCALCMACAAVGFVGCGDGGNDTGDNTNTEQNGGVEIPPVTYTVTYDANGGTFSNGKTSITVTVEENAKLTAPESPSRKNYSFSGWGNKSGNDMWDFATDTVTGNVTIYATWKQQAAIILSVDGASIEEKEIFMLVDGETDSVSLADKVICSDDSTWRLYYDKLGQTEIPTKIASGLNGYLQQGSNDFYVVVTSKDGVQVNVYELNVCRSFPIPVYYMDGTELLNTSYGDAGYEYVADYVPQIKGYTFNYWEAEDGTRYQTQKLLSGISLTANKTANTYTVAFDVDGGDELSTTEKILTYDDTYTLPTPTHADYTFLGWSYNGAFLTDGNGKSILPWGIANEVTLTAEWERTDLLPFTYEMTNVGINITGVKDNSVRTLSIPSDVINIKKGAFADCANITEITILFVGATKGGTENTHFGYIFGANDYTSNADCVPVTLKSVVILNGVTSIDEYAFSGCSGLRSVEIPNSATLPSLHPQNNYCTL